MEYTASMNGKHTESGGSWENVLRPRDEVDPYKILDISEKATLEEIKVAYRTRVKLFHPDTNKEGEEDFKAISNAFDLLSDASKRGAYDRGEIDIKGHREQNPRRRSASASTASAQAPQKMYSGWWSRKHDVRNYTPSQFSKMKVDLEELKKEHGAYQLRAKEPTTSTAESEGGTSVAVLKRTFAEFADIVARLYVIKNELVGVGGEWIGELKTFKSVLWNESKIFLGKLREVLETQNSFKEMLRIFEMVIPPPEEHKGGWGEYVIFEAELMFLNKVFDRVLEKELNINDFDEIGAIIDEKKKEPRYASFYGFLSRRYEKYLLSQE